MSGHARDAMEHLDDDILRHILRRITTPEARHAMARTARRYLAAIRLEETLHLEISCASWALERVGFGSSRPTSRRVARVGRVAALQARAKAPHRDGKFPLDDFPQRDRVSQASPQPVSSAPSLL